MPLNRTAVAPLKFVPLIVTLAPTSPLVGVKLVIVGGLETVTVTEFDDHWRFARSRATAIKVCDPFFAVIVSHETEYGAEVSSEPRLLPSSLNWTPWTVSEPTILTVALTGVGPLTVEPEAGDVIVTMRLPTGSGKGGTGGSSWGAA